MAVPGDDGGRGGLQLLVYAVVVGSALATLLVVLHAGRSLDLVPQLPLRVSVNDEAATCLGTELVAVQSGVFVELYVPVAASPADEALGRGIADARVDRESHRLPLSGRCAAGPTDGQSFGASVVLLDVAQGLNQPVAEGAIEVDGRSAPLVLHAAGTDGAAGSTSVTQLTPEDVVGRVFLAVAVVCLAALLCGNVFKRFGQPRVLGEILAGILLGPTLLGAVSPEATVYLFPGQVLGSLRVLAQVGLILFMFVVGLRLDTSELRGKSHAAVLVSHVSIAVPFTLGVVLALLLYPLVGSGPFTGFALFMGAAMAITAFPVLARILSDTGFDRTHLGALAITCAAVDDVTAWCLLAVVTAVVRSQGFVDVVATIVLSAAFAVGVFLVVRPVLARVATRYRAGAHQAQAQVVVGVFLAALFLAAWATETIGSHAIFGAFLLGVAVPRSGPLASDLVEKIEDVTAVVLLPIFFAVVGLSTRIGVDGRPLAWWAVALLVLATAVAGKWGASTFAARASGFDWRESNALGVLMNTRGLTEIVILTIGRSLGVVSSALFAMMVLMALFTTVMAAPILRALYPGGPQGGTGAEHRGGRVPKNHGLAGEEA